MTRKLGIQRKQVGGLMFVVDYDPYPEDPRLEETLTEIVCWHRKYQMGDKRPEDPEDFLETVQKGDVVKRLYLYDHGGLSLSTTPYDDQWDSMWIGFVRVRPDAMERGGLTMDEEVVDRTIAIEIEELEKYVNGSCYMVDVHRVIDGDLLMTPVATGRGVWDLDDGQLDDAAATAVLDVDERYAKGMCYEDIAARSWET